MHHHCMCVQSVVQSDNCCHWMTPSHQCSLLRHDVLVVVSGHVIYLQWCDVWWSVDTKLNPSNCMRSVWVWLYQAGTQWKLGVNSTRHTHTHSWGCRVQWVCVWNAKSHAKYPAGMLPIITVKTLDRDREMTGLEYACMEGVNGSELSDVLLDTRTPTNVLSYLQMH